jgi:hypothetical protein
MSEVIKAYFLVFIVLLMSNKLIAQSGSCGSTGLYINYNDFVNYDRTVGGDVEIATAGYVEIGSLGNWENYGAIVNDGIIEIDSGGVLTLYGDMENNGSLILHKGAVLHFYGKKWKNGLTSVVGDGAPANTIPGGDLNFIASRPVVPSSWLVLSPCLSIYSGGDSVQCSDGANIPMDVVFRLKNPNNIVLVNSTTRIEGKLQWDVANSDVVLGNNDLVLTENASQDGYQSDRFVITNGTGHLVKENYLGNWTFPVGIADGDYTPAAINNSLANTMHVLVQDYATSTSDEIIADPSADGMQRTWNIYADIATGNSMVTLQHNSSTNQPLFDDAYNFVTRWGIATPNTTGDIVLPYSTSAWQTNTPSPGTIGVLSSAGAVAGSNMQSKNYTDFAVLPSEAIAFFTKSSDPIHPLPIDLLSFTALSNECSAQINFRAGVERSISRFQIQRSVDGKIFSTIASLKPTGSNSDYRFVDVNAPSGRNYYRLSMIELNGDYRTSSTITVNIECNANTLFNVYPNPAHDFINLSGLNIPSEIRITTVDGKILGAFSANSSKMILDIREFSQATYWLTVFNADGSRKSLKFIKY